MASPYAARLRTRLSSYVQASIVSLSSDPEWTWEDGIYLLDSCYTHVSDDTLIEKEDSLVELAVKLIDEYISAMDGDFDLPDEEVERLTSNVIPFKKKE